MLQRFLAVCGEGPASGDVWSVRLRLSGVITADRVPPFLLQLVGDLPLLHLGVVGVENDFPVYQAGRSSLHREDVTLLWIGEGRRGNERF